MWSTEVYRVLIEAPVQVLPTAPDVDGRRVPLLPQQELRGAVPQGNHLVGVRSTESNHTHTQSQRISEETLRSNSQNSTQRMSHVLGDTVTMREESRVARQFQPPRGECPH